MNAPRVRFSLLIEGVSAFSVAAHRGTENTTVSLTDAPGYSYKVWIWLMIYFALPLTIQRFREASIFM